MKIKSEESPQTTTQHHAPQRHLKNPIYNLESRSRPAKTAARIIKNRNRREKAPGDKLKNPELCWQKPAVDGLITGKRAENFLKTKQVFFSYE